MKRRRYIVAFILAILFQLPSTAQENTSELIENEINISNKVNSSNECEALSIIPPTPSNERRTIFKETGPLQERDRKNDAFRISLYTDVVQDCYLIPSLGIEMSYNNLAVFTDTYYSNWAQRNVFDLNAGIRCYFGRGTDGLFTEAFFKKNDSDISYKDLLIKDGLGGGIGFGVRMNVNETVGFILFTRGGWINHSRVRYIEGAKVFIGESNIEVIGPNVIDTSKNYFGFFNIGCILTITL